MNDIVDDYTILRRIKEKLDKHDKSLFTAFELNLLRDVVNHYLKDERKSQWD